jgi:hypothetical protein
MSELFDPVGDDCYDEEPPTIPTSSEVDALQDAGWHLRQIRILRKRLGEAGDLFHREYDRIQEWYDGEADRLNAKIAWHEAPLRQLSERLREADPKRSTIRLPDGTMSLRVPVKPQARIDDDDALLAWAVEHAPSLLPAPRRVKVMDLRRETVAHPDGKVVLTATGEIVPHASAVVPEPTWSCDVEVES